VHADRETQRLGSDELERPGRSDSLIPAATICSRLSAPLMICKSSTMWALVAPSEEGQPVEPTCSSTRTRRPQQSCKPLPVGFRRVPEYLDLVTHMPMHVAR
jgi:hypothetical protein